jgi:predicted dehydrogenase
LAFLGCGFATHLHSKTLSKFKNQVVCYYASRSSEKASFFNSKFKGAGYFNSYESAVNSPEIDIVLIATPPSTHMDLALMALQSGKHVIVEKPPFLNTEQFDKVAKLSNQLNLQLMIAENYFYKPLAVKLRQILKLKPIGDVLFINLNALKLQKINSWRENPFLSGGGALFEGGIHWINFLSNLGYKVKNIHGFQPKSISDVDKSMLVVAEFEEGIVGSLHYSWEVPSMFKGLRISRIYGREGSITFESNGLFILVSGRFKKFILPGFKDILGYKAMFNDFLKALRTGDEPKFNLTLARQDLKLLEIIYNQFKINHS